MSYSSVAHLSGMLKMVIWNEIFNHTKSRLTGVVFRTFATSQRVSASHYDVLGVTPKATQADIKSAYYKLSKVYHPDKSSDEESAKKFRAITEAYEVLGNVKLKKMYDKGLLVGEVNKSRMGTEYTVDPEPTDPTLKFYKSRAKRHITPTFQGRTAIYDFDEWAKNHYGDLLQKAKVDKEFINRRREKEREYAGSVNQEITIFILALSCLSFLFLATYGKSEYDLDTTAKNKKTDNANKSNTESVTNS